MKQEGVGVGVRVGGGELVGVCGYVFGDASYRSDRSSIVFLFHSLV
jgi:hypothetical protein